jgi:hypothetical protein
MGKWEDVGPQMALAYRLDAILQGPKNSPFPGRNPLPLAQVMYLPESKTLCTGP